MTVPSKRRRISPQEPSLPPADPAEAFRKHFEARFAPLPGSKRSPTTVDDVVRSRVAEADEDTDSSQSEEEQEWAGLSSEDSEQGDGTEEPLRPIEVIDHSVAQVPKASKLSKREVKALLSSKIPDQSTFTADPSAQAPSPASAKKTLPEDAPSLLKQDLELRRLLSESHLLAPSLSTSVHAINNNNNNNNNGGSSSQGAQARSFAAGRTRSKTTDLRVQALGSNVSVHKQDKMPMGMRKGIVAAASGREAKRRREAWENGIILERQSSSSASAGGLKGKGRRARQKSGLDRPEVGRMKGAQLNLSERDVRRIEGSKDVFGRRNKR